MSYIKMSTTRTNPQLWETVKNEVQNKAMYGTDAGKWSARKAQAAVLQYKKRGGEYVGKKSPKNDLVKWTLQDWTTKTGEPSSKTGQRYLPKAAIKALTSSEYAATTKAKRQGMAQGIQYVPQPAKIAAKVAKFRK